MRSYTTFTQAADENAISRVYVGFHFRNATVEGTNYGRKIGERAVTLLPAVTPTGASGQGPVPAGRRPTP